MPSRKSRYEMEEVEFMDGQRWRESGGNFWYCSRERAWSVWAIHFLGSDRRADGDGTFGFRALQQLFELSAWIFFVILVLISNISFDLFKLKFNSYPMPLCTIICVYVHCTKHVLTTQLHRRQKLLSAYSP